MAVRIVSGGPRPHRWVLGIALAPAWLVLHWYAQRLGAPLSFTLTFTLLGLGPALAAGEFWQRTPLELGFGLGQWRFGSAALLAGLPLAVAAGYLGAGSAELRAVYPLDPAASRAASAFLAHAALYALYYVGFEFFFRGFLLLGAAERLGPIAANLLQSGLATLVHAGKPDIEVLAAFPASLAFGWLALRTRSIWYGVTIHAAVGISLDWFLLA